MKMNDKYFIGGICALSVCLFIYAGFTTDSDVALVDKSHTPSMKGVCWVAGDSIAGHNIDQIMDVHANWISQTPFGWMESHQSTKVVLNNERAWWGETDKGLAHTAELARASGVKSILKPHIWLRRGEDGKFRADIKMKSKEEWDDWFQSYQDWILHYAKLAEASEMEALCIGTELHQTIKHPDRWRSIIREIRKVYSGQITYAANWYHEYQDVTFWDELDFIGIQAYFPLSSQKNPDKKALIKSWSKHKKDLKKLSKKYNKKIVFTEIGYKNTADAAKDPWTWPQDLDHSVERSDETQIVCYHALFESLWHEPWFDGLFIWKWFHTTYKHENYQDYFIARQERRKQWAKRRGRELGPQVYFTPQHSPAAMEVMGEWYGGIN